MLPTRIRDLNMRKLHLLLFLAVLFCMASCGNYITKIPNHVTNKATFDKAIRSVQSKLESQGFRYLGYENTSPDLLVVSDIKTRRRNSDCYRFMDKQGNTLTYSIALSPYSPLLSEIDVCDCETSNPHDHERFCGDEGVVNQVLAERRMKGYEKRYLYENTSFDSIVDSIQSRIRSQGFVLIGYEYQGIDCRKYDHRDSYDYVDSFGNIIRISAFRDGSKGKSEKNKAALYGFDLTDFGDYEKCLGDIGVIRQTIKNQDFGKDTPPGQAVLKSLGYRIKGYRSVITKRHGLHQNTYYFTDGLGNTMDYAVYYMLKKSSKGDCVSYYELCECKTSNPDDFERLFVDDGVFKPINDLPGDLSVIRDKIYGAILSFFLLSPSIITAILVFGK